jgi:hypothetical protein
MGPKTTAASSYQENNGCFLRDQENDGWFLGSTSSVFYASLIDCWALVSTLLLVYGSFVWMRKFICCQLLLLEYSVHMKWKLYVIRMDHTIPWMPLCTRSLGIWAGRAYKGSSLQHESGLCAPR